MAPILINVSTTTTTTTINDEESANSFLPEGAILSLSDMKFGDEATRSYPFKFLGITTPEKQFYCGLRFVFTSEASALDITYASGNGSILVRLGEDHAEVNRVVSFVESELKKLLGPAEAHLLAPIKKEPTNSMYDPALSLKTRKTALDVNHSSPQADLTRGHTLVKYVITVNRLNYFQGKYYAALNLTACVLQPTPPRGSGSAHGQSGENETDFFAMMMMDSNSTTGTEISAHA
jgi:hypothetical protein